MTAGQGGLRRHRPGRGSAIIVNQVTVGLTAATTTGSTWLDWGRSGARRRSSYELLDVVERAGLLPSHLSPLAVAWYLVPAMCGACLLALATGRNRLAVASGAAVAVLVLACVGLVVRSSLVTEPGAVLGAVAATGTILACLRLGRTATAP